VPALAQAAVVAGRRWGWLHLPCDPVLVRFWTRNPGDDHNNCAAEPDRPSI